MPFITLGLGSKLAQAIKEQGYVEPTPIQAKAIPVLRRNIEHSNAQHHQIVGAILGGNAERARAVMEEHCDATSALLRGLIG